MSERGPGEPVVWYVMPSEGADTLLLYADRLEPGDAAFPLALRVPMSAARDPAALASALRRIAEAVERTRPAIEEPDASWCLEVRLQPEPDE